MTTEGPAFVTPDTLMRKKQEHSVNFDQRALSWEDKSLVDRKRALTNSISSYLSEPAINQLYLSWKASLEELLGLKKDASTSAEVTNAMFGAQVVHRAGAMIKIGDSLSRFFTALQRRGKDASELAALEAFSSILPVDLASHGVSLRKIAEQTKRNKLPLAAQLSFFMALKLFPGEQFQRTLLEENPSELAREFPNIVLEAAGQTGNILTGVINLSNNRDMPEYRDIKRRFPLTAPVTETLLEKTHEFRDGLAMTIIDPSAKEFTALKEKIQEYFGASPEIQSFLIHLFSNNRAEGLQDLFRKAMEQRDLPEHGDFYRKFAGMVEGYVDILSAFTQLRTADEIEEIFIEREGDAIADTPSFNDYRVSVAKIIGKKPRDKDVYDIDIDALSWTEFVPPQSVTLTFSPGKPMEFVVDITYEAENEGTSLWLGVDAKRQEFEWNYLEDPESDKMQQFSSAAKRVVMAALQEVEKTTKDEWERRKATVVRKVEPPKGNQVPQPKIPPDSGTTTLVASTKRRHRQSGDALSVVAETVSLETGKARNIIVLKEQAEMGEVMKGLTAGDQEKVITRINEYNKRGVGRLKMLGIGSDGRKRYSYRINIGAKGVRVLLTEGESTSGQRSFEIVDIKRRREVYRNI
ncbi:MAG: hypothetical protein AAB553_01715 [Patescibacteria group bacterium]